MYFGNDLAKHRQADLMREAQAYRAGKEAGTARARERRSARRRMLSAAVGFVLGPFRH